MSGVSFNRILPTICVHMCSVSRVSRHEESGKSGQFVIAPSYCEIELEFRVSFRAAKSAKDLQIADSSYFEILRRASPTQDDGDFSQRLRMTLSTDSCRAAVCTSPGLFRNPCRRESSAP